MSKNFLTAPVANLPTAGSQQRIAAETSKTRNKVALKPGRSLMDWIRLGASGKDLTSVGGKILTVTEAELKKHNKIDDAWTCLRGKVYNITPYMEFHPGGIDELMKAAGKDGTELFDEIHKWVNFESMLQKCLVGKMKALVPPLKAISEKMAPPSSGSVLSKLLPKKPLTKANLMEKTITDSKEDNNTSTGNKESTSDMEKVPKIDWYQNESNINITIFTYRPNILSVSDILIYKNDSVMHVSVILGCKKFIIHIELSNNIVGKPSVKLQVLSGKIDIVFRKSDPSVYWPTLGKPLENHCHLLDMKDCKEIYMNCTLTSVKQVTHDTKLLTLTLPEGNLMITPIGHHIHLRYDIQGMVMVRSYTVVTPDVASKFENDGSVLHLLIKIYKDGVLTPSIDALSEGDTVSVSQHTGNFSINQIKNVQELNLFAAGTGITPMIPLMNYALNCFQNNFKINLKFYNKTEKDIIWQEKFDELQQRNDNFDVKYILSEPSKEWNKKKGKITDDDVDALEPSKTSFLCACGPTAFTNSVIKIAKEKGYNDLNSHAFLG